MAGTLSSDEHQSLVMTTETVDDVTQTTTANVAMTSSSLGIEFYFRCANVVIGAVGMVANALILYALVASKQHKKHVLILHQNVIDFVGCFFLVITYSVKLGNIYLTGLGGYLLCIVLQSRNLVWATILASKVNLMVITIERYLKVCYPVWSKKKLRQWILHTGAAVAWISSLVHMFAVVILTTFVKDGVCYASSYWPDPVAHLFYLFWASTSYYIVALVIFIFCYWRILLAIRRQANVMAAHSASGPSTAHGQAQSNLIQTNIIKTMILVCTFYVITDTPRVVYALLVAFYARWYSVLLAAIFMSFLSICANPFIYATKFDPVKRVLLSLIPCKKTPVQPVENIEANVPGTGAKRAGQIAK